MTGSGLMDFLISVVGLLIIVFLIYKALDYISPDVNFKMIARYAVGGAALLIFLLAVKGVLFGGSGMATVSPAGVLTFAIGLIVTLVVLYIIYMVVDQLAPPNLLIPIKYVIGAIALIAILVLAQQVMFGGLAIGGNTFRQIGR